MRPARAAGLLAVLAAVTTASCAAKYGAPANVPGQRARYSSLFLKATELQKFPLFGYCARIHGVRRSGMTGEDGTTVVDSIPAGRWVVRSIIYPNPEQLDTLDFVAGCQETLWIDVFGWARHSEIDIVDRRNGGFVDTSRSDTASKYQRRLRPQPTE